MTELVADVCALIDATGARRVHLVGHDWGAAVAWVVAASAPQRLATLTALSVPHPAGFQKAVVTSRQGLASWYMFFFRLPRIERVLLGRDGRAAGLPWLVPSKWKQTSAFADRDIAAMTEPGALTAALNWYRAIPFQDVRRSGEKITVPTMFAWSDGDVPIVQQGVQHCGRYVNGEYRFVTLHDVGHHARAEARRGSRPAARLDLRPSRQRLASCGDQAVVGADRCGDSYWYSS
jgi:pimeloyl-ACP methyl ester carboxylesterase